MDLSQWWLVAPAFASGMWTVIGVIKFRGWLDRRHAEQEAETQRMVDALRMREEENFDALPGGVLRVLSNEGAATAYFQDPSQGEGGKNTESGAPPVSWNCLLCDPLWHTDDMRAIGPHLEEVHQM